MRILVVGDGPRDRLALPNLICRLLGKEVQTRFDDWHHVSHLKGKGSIYAKKLKYLTRRAKADEFTSLAIVVDADKEPARKKLRQLYDGRDQERQKHPPFPTAVGEANPHFDIWLLDDPVAIREALQLPSDYQIPNAVKVEYPKETIDELIEKCEVEFDETSLALDEIARRVHVNRCVHSKETGLAGFEREFNDEIAPVIS